MAVGGVGEKGIDAAAQLSALGIDPLRFLYTKDPLERDLMIEVGRRSQKYVQQLHKNLAGEIISLLSKSLSGK